MITIKGAREHNLKNISVSIPRNKITVITGLSGSGKSSLAFDTVYAEGQRLYMESLSSYARQFLEQIKKPDVDSIDGLSASMAIDQKSLIKNPRSTVGTATEIYDYLRLLYAKIGDSFCPNGHGKISSTSTSTVKDSILKHPHGTKFLVLAPIVSGRKGQFKKELESFQKKGFSKIRIDGEMHDLSKPIELDKNKNHTLDLLIDQLVIDKGVDLRLQKAIDLGSFQSRGGVLFHLVKEKKDLLFNTKLSCTTCQFNFPDIESRFFSFNSPYGACPHCQGIGEKRSIDKILLIQNPHLSLKEGAIPLWLGASSLQILESLAQHLKFALNTPFRKLPPEIADIILYGTQETISFSYLWGQHKYEFDQPFEGIIPNLERRYHESKSQKKRDQIEKYFNVVICPACNGARLKNEALSIKINNSSITELCHNSISKTIEIMKQWMFSERQETIGKKIRHEILERLSFLENIGLGYLSLDRSTSSLSTGEAQRIKLAAQLGSYLTGVLYVLDEPSIGLHPKDHQKLLSSLMKLKETGNTLLIVEHDEDTMLSADYLIDMGPGAGEAGGKVVACGTPADVKNNPDSLTGQYLSGSKKMTVTSSHPEPFFVPRSRAWDPKKKLSDDIKYITIKGVTSRNLKSIDIRFPLGKFICVTGVSGSGKSSLVMDTLLPLLNNVFYKTNIPSFCVARSIEGVGNIDKVIHVDQSPIGKTPRSNPATYTGIFAPLRDLFAGLPISKIRGFTAGRFSFNISGGRCELCEGSGMLKIEMHFLPDMYVPCSKCEGKRYNPETLQVTYKGKNISDVLNLSIDEAYELFNTIPQIKPKLLVLKEVGLGYIRLGQQAPTLSGGEAQRIKLARELGKRSTGKTLFILDEPTTGLHFDDIHKLLLVLQSLVNQGNTVIVIEHQLDVIAHADHIIDMGPEGGEAGGEVVFSGSPDKITQNSKSYTGQFLKKKLFLPS